MTFTEIKNPETHAGRNGASASSPIALKASHLPLPTRIAFVGNYLPRECGIATFTTDLCTALAGEYGKERLFAIPVNDPDSSYDYPEQVRLELMQEDIASYERAADFLNFNSNDLVCLQHEYGIYGGAAGRYILAMLRRLKMPLVTTLHTVLREPDANQRIVLEEIAQLSDRLIVMSELAAQLLREVYAVPAGKIDVIPHGVPDMPFMDPNYFKDKFGTEGKSVLLTFGLLSPNKGIENVIRALPAILARHPNVVYIVSGVTHPHIRKRDGERYREELQALAAELGVSSHLILNNRFVSTEELIEHVGAADIYITPYRQEAQIVSGTLAIALGAGKAIISTPYLHAKELLADKRGVIVPFDNPDAIAKSVVELLENDAERHAMRKRAYLHSRGTTWPTTARAYMATFQRARFERSLKPRAAQSDEIAVGLIDQTEHLPALNTNHLFTMTDDTGMLQHAIFSVPNTREGYTTDDNARALIVSTLLNDSVGFPHGEDHLNLSRRYLAFLWLAFHSDTGRFRNFLGYDRQWLEDVGSEDSHGRALWALGSVLGHSQNAGLRGAAGRLLRPPCPSFSNSAARARGHSAFLGFRPISTGSPATGPSKSRATRWPIACSIFTSAAVPISGIGSRRVLRTPMRGWRRLSSWPADAARTGRCSRRESSRWNGLSPRSIAATRICLFPSAPAVASPRVVRSRASISSPSKPAPPSPLVLRHTGSRTTSAGATKPIASSVGSSAKTICRRLSTMQPRADAKMDFIPTA
jgi:glycosyltransferase involved in cell wall biosynthesis